MIEPDMTAAVTLAPIRRIPLYEQATAGLQLMSERELPRALGVSRSSPRQALTALRLVGVIDVRCWSATLSYAQKPAEQFAGHLPVQSLSYGWKDTAHVALTR